MSGKSDSSVVKKSIIEKVRAIKGAIKAAEKTLNEGVITEERINDMSASLQDMIDDLHNIAKKTPEAIIQGFNLENEIERLEYQIKFPNHRVKIFSKQQETERELARVELERWSTAGVGVSMNDLSPDEIGKLSRCASADWSPLTVKIEEMLRKNNTKNPSILTSYRNVAIGCFEAVVPQWFGHNIPEQATMTDPDMQHLLDCIAAAAVDICQDDHNPLSVFADAIRFGNLKTVGDIVSSGFGLCVLGQSGLGAALDATVSLTGLGMQAVTYVVTNPAASFVTYTAVEPYIRALITKVLNERFPPGQQQPQDIKVLFDMLSEYYIDNGVTDIIGFPPADLDSIRNKLSQLLYEAGYRVVSSTQTLVETVRAALKFPMRLCKIAKKMGDAIKTTWSNFGIKLIDRYGVMPHNMNGWFPRVMQCLESKGLLDGEHPIIEMAVRRCLNHSLPSIPYHHLVTRLAHLSDLQYGALLPPGQLTESLGAVKDPNSSQGSVESVGPLNGSGLVMNDGEIHGDVDVLSSNGEGLADFRVQMQAIMARAIDVTESIAEKIRGDIEQQKREKRAVVRGASARSSSAFDTQPRSSYAPGGSAFGGFAFGGRSRSRKSSVSKRTRRKGLAKKQKSNKNKLQSRRKVRRASSRKLRK